MLKINYKKLNYISTKVKKLETKNKIMIQEFCSSVLVFGGTNYIRKEKWSLSCCIAAESGRLHIYL